MLHASTSTALAQTACGLTTQCGLDRALAYLYGTAGLLAIVLVVVIAAAVAFFVHNKRRGPK
jgi:UDP-N-acetylmuramyl pentapeptide phosphotransferase/UDP-N-acetylglucosamine-1-phosphate transferase